MKKSFLISLLSILVSLPIPSARAMDLVETPSLKTDVEAGKLPPVAQRIPKNPSVVNFTGEGVEPGRHGGRLNILMGRKKDTRQMVVYGYARLAGYDQSFNIKPDILAKLDVKEGRIFTLHLRAGHKWSDGHPFTAEDFRYYWEDVATNTEVRNESPPAALIVDGERAKFEVLDDVTIRYSWSKPNPFFLPRLAGARPLYLYRPAHYMKKYHAKYTDAATLQAQVKAAKKRNWVALHYAVGQQYKNANPDLPTLQPWMLATKPPAKRFAFKRNPYYYRIDAKGRQLPYIDEVRMNVTNNKLIPIKTGSGESDLQARGLNFSNVTALKQSEKQSGFSTLLWRTAKGSRWALFPNLTVQDPVWRKLFRDVRFRRAMSLGINRREINQVIYYGLAREGNNTVLPESPLYQPKFQKRWATFDIKRANALLDEMGLTKKTPAGIRLLPNGKRLELTVVFSTEESEPSDVMELIRDSWRNIGIKLFLKPMQRDVLRNRIFSGLVKMSMWFGLENGIPSPDSSPQELAPTSQQQLQWPKWGQHVETRGRAGEKTDMPLAVKLAELNKVWAGATSRDERHRIWTEMLDIYTNQLFSIGIISSVPQVVVTKKNLRNVPKVAIYNWDPGAHFGVYRPDQFWFSAKSTKRKLN
jgi:peptide/nickel transport system substrate-binding protein